MSLMCATFACMAYAAEQPSAPAQYDFAYAVNDPTTGDQKDQQESRNGDDVVGYYRTVDADGYLRTVKYKSDAVNGFTAEVVREPVGGAAAVPAPAPAVQKAVPVPVPVVPKAVIRPAAVPVVTRAPAPVVLPAPYVAPAAYPYNYQPSYSYGYQPYPYAYSPYSYGQYPYSSQYPFSSQYTFGGQYPYVGQYAAAPTFRK